MRVDGLNELSFIGNRCTKKEKTVLCFLMFLSTLFIGADKFGINIGVNIRFDQIIILITSFLMLVFHCFRFHNNKWIIGWLAFSLLSSLFAFNVNRGLIFYFSIVYNVIFLFYLYSNFVYFFGIKGFLDIFRKTCSIQVFLIIGQFILKLAFHYELPFLPSYGEYLGVSRFCLWFYEPSYFATYMIFWLALASYMFFLMEEHSYLPDLVLCVIGLLISTSSSGIVGIALVFICVYTAWLIRGFSTKKLLVLLALIAFTISFFIAFPSFYNVFVKRIFSGDLNSASGGRIAQWKETFNVFLEKPLFGVGPGNYGLYLFNDTRLVPSNVTLEMLATLGIFPTICFFALNVSLLIRTLRLYKANPKDNAVILALVFALFIFSVILQINQGYLRLYHWMFFGVIDGAIRRNEKDSSLLLIKQNPILIYEMLEEN